MMIAAVSTPGGDYNPSTDTWTATNPTRARPRLSPAVWTGSENDRLGRRGLRRHFFNNRGKYDPAQIVGYLPALSTRLLADPITLQCEGSEMIVWGGTNITLLETAADIIQQRHLDGNHTIGGGWATLSHAVWISSEMIVWGGYASGAIRTLAEDIIRAPLVG